MLGSLLGGWVQVCKRVCKRQGRWGWGKGRLQHRKRVAGQGGGEGGARNKGMGVQAGVKRKLGRQAWCVGCWEGLEI